ncbi:MAG: hypothetical protein JWL71_4756 [Acidobacteria bacterium]|jgi:subtilase family serine protease|nr:hypothetical protein [Acidobacteriota bacterium]
MVFRFSAACALVLAGLLSMSCGGIVDPSQNQVEPFSGTVNPGSFSARAFSSSKTGEITIKMLTITPASVPYLGVQWVQGDGTSCNGAPLQAQIAGPNSTAISAQIVSGQYCVVVSDVIGLAQPANYTLTVSHP